MAQNTAFQIWEISEKNLKTKNDVFIQKKDQISRGKYFENWPHSEIKFFDASSVAVYGTALGPAKMPTPACISPFRGVIILGCWNSNINLNIATAIVSNAKAARQNSESNILTAVKFRVEMVQSCQPDQQVASWRLQIVNTNERRGNLAKLKRKIKTVECDLHFAYFLPITEQEIKFHFFARRILWRCFLRIPPLNYSDVEFRSKFWANKREIASQDLKTVNYKFYKVRSFALDQLWAPWRNAALVHQPLVIAYYSKAGKIRIMWKIM